jgi:hypothetical protein
MRGLKLALLSFTIISFLFIGCNSVPKDDPFKFSEGEVVYYAIDNVPMLVEKQIFKKGKKQYRVVFKNEEGFLQYNTVAEEEILSTPQQSDGE